MELNGGSRFCRQSVTRSRRSLLCVFGLALTGCGVWLRAQDEPKVVDDGVPTLHVYTNLVQVPTLVLTMTNDPVRKPIAESKFSVSIDSGRWFRATHVRQEGDDPISLSILLDVSGDTTGLMPRIGDALGNLAPSLLHPRDRVSVYALDCSLHRSLKDAPADSMLLKKAVGVALESWKLRKSNKREESCGSKGRLWDSLAQVAIELSNLPGRRVILMVTDGHDTGSKHSSNEVRTFAQATGAAVFALTYTPPLSAGIEMSRQGRGVYIPRGGPLVVSEDPLISVCELSGGIVMKMSDPTALPASFERFVKMLRERYIVEFPRPANSTPGEHGMEVKIDKGSYLIRPSGVSMPVADAGLLADPTTIQAGPALTPEQGTRKVMTKPQ
jgi:hypothetical protein